MTEWRSIEHENPVQVTRHDDEYVSLDSFIGLSLSNPRLRDHLPSCAEVHATILGTTKEAGAVS